MPVVVPEMTRSAPRSAAVSHVIADLVERDGAGGGIGGVDVLGIRGRGVAGGVGDGSGGDVGGGIGEQRDRGGRHGDAETPPVTVPV